MSLYILGKQKDRNRIADELKKLHPNISIHNHPHDPGSSFAVQVVPGGDDTPGGKCLATLLSSKKDTVILAVPEPDVQPGWGGGETLGALGGGTALPLSESGVDHLITPSGKNGPGATALVAVDASDNNGKGYYTFDETGKPINDPLFAILANELSDGHAYQFVTGSTPRIPSESEKKSIEHENDVRGSVKPPKKERAYAKRGLAAGAVPVGTGNVTTRPPNSN